MDSTETLDEFRCALSDDLVVNNVFWGQIKKKSIVTAAKGSTENKI